MTVEPIPRASLRSLEILMAARAHLTLPWKETSWQFVFFPVGRAFLRESCCGTVSLAESVTSCQGEKKDRYAAHSIGTLPHLSDLPVGVGRL